MQIETYQPLIINIHHKDEPKLYTVRVEGSGKQIAGFDTIQQVDHWLKLSGGQWDSGPIDTPQGYYRKARISPWAYNRLLDQIRQKAAA